MFKRSRPLRRRGRRSEDPFMDAMRAFDDETAAKARAITPEVIMPEKRASSARGLVKETPVSRIVAYRNAALAEAARAVTHLAEGFERAAA